ncbi:MAG TPA: arginine deiminase-related protein [Chthoniobacterales bacterium]|nr:arginine deiminase-related protein [Chthoniobacterales bacterium]
MIQQSANAVVMIRPFRFYPNPETASDNAFQREVASGDAGAISHSAQEEFDRAVESLRGAGVTTHVFADTASPEKPDAVFPNNWFSTHPDGRVALYPMYSPTRRNERRRDVIDELGQTYQISALVDYSSYEQRGLHLEGTGSLVLDYANSIAYVSLSKRSDRELVERFCQDFNFEPLLFESAGDDGRPIYHTNVVMCVGSEFALVGLDMIRDPGQRETVRHRLETSGKKVIELSRAQIANFAGNALELRNESEKLLVLSSRAAEALTTEQRNEIESHARLLPLTLPTIELAGGSARCMLAAIHLPPL